MDRHDGMGTRYFGSWWLCNDNSEKVTVMNTKTTLLLAVAAVVVAAFLLFVERPWKEASEKDESTTTAKALFKFEPTDANRVELTIKDKKAIYAKKDDHWKMLEPIECPASDSEIKGLVDKVAKVEYLKEYEQGDGQRPNDSVTKLDKPIGQVSLFKDETGLP